MLKHIVFILREYYPTFGPTGNCMNNIIKEMKKGNHVSVISSKTSFQMSSKENYNGLNIYRVNNYRSCFFNLYREKNSTLGTFAKLFWKSLYYSARTFSAFLTTFRFRSIQTTLLTRFIKKIREVDEIQPIDIIVAAGQPYESSIAALKFKQKNRHIKVFNFLYDHLAENTTLNRFQFLKTIRYPFNKNIERKIVVNSNFTFILPQLKEHYDCNFGLYQHKYEEFEHPLLIEHNNILSENQNINTSSDPESINIVYAGMLDKRFRNPKYFLDTLSKLNDFKLTFSVFHSGNCGDILDSYQGKLINRLNNFGKVNLEVALEAMSKADILISFGVVNGNQVSGKIFDYFSFGKPIVHFYFFDGDPNLAYFRKYPDALCLKVDYNNIQENADKLSQFFQRKRVDTLSFDEVESIFYDATPRYVANKLWKYMET